MCDTGYSLKRLVTDLKELRQRAASEKDLVEAVPDLAKRMVLHKHNWLRPHMCEASTTDDGSAGVYRLHEEADHSLAIFVVTWLPGDETPPHNHATWAVIAGLEGSETNHWWRRTDDGRVPGYAKIERAGTQRIDPANIVAMPGDAIHSLHNDSSAASVTLHLYGHNVDYTERCKFDPAANTMAPYKLGGRVHHPLTGDRS